MKMDQLASEGDDSYNNNNTNDQPHHHRDEYYVVTIYPPRNYYFGSKLPLPPKGETLAERAQRMRANYTRDELRACVEAILLVELFKHPHLLLFQVSNSFFKLPGGSLRRGESKIDGLKHNLSRKLSFNEDGFNIGWGVGECLQKWWRPDFETLMFTFMGLKVHRPKECTTFSCKIARKSEIHCTKKLKVACSSIM